MAQAKKQSITPEKRRLATRRAGAKTHATPSRHHGRRDQLEQIGREMGELIAIMNKVEEMEFVARNADNGSDAARLESLEERLVHRLYQLENAIPGNRANSVYGAIVSLVRASCLADHAQGEWTALAEETGKTTAAYAEYNRIHRDLKATLYSVLAVLRSLAPGVYESTESNYYMSLRLDPFSSTSEASRCISEVNRPE